MPQTGLSHSHCSFNSTYDKKIMGIQNSDVTIIVPTRGRREWAQSILDHVEHRPLMFVIDRGRAELDLPTNLNGAQVIEVEPGQGCPKTLEKGIEACQTRLFLCLVDDVRFTGVDFVGEAIRVYQEKIGEGIAGVVGLNNGIEKGEIACFALIDKLFYMTHCYPTPYEKYYQDNEWTNKARTLKSFGYAANALVQHVVCEPQCPIIGERDGKLFVERMSNFKLGKPLDRAQKLFVGIPIYGGVEPFFFRSMMHLVAEYPCDIRIQEWIGDSAVGRARNGITRMFLDSDCTDLLFIDSDLIFSPQQVKRLIEHDVDIVGGFYPKKQDGPIQLVCNTHFEPVEPRDDGLMDVRYMGTGFLRIKREVFEKIIAEGKADWYWLDNDRSVKEYDFWHMGVYNYPDGGKRYLSEDWWFCQMALDCGYKVYGDTRLPIKHCGSAIYPLKHQEEQLFGRRKAPDSCAGDTAEIPTAEPAQVTP